MKKSSYIPFYTSDFLGGTGGMTAATKGVYITLLCMMYESEAPLTQSDGVLARRCGCQVGHFRKSIADLIDDGKIVITDAGIWSEKCDRHIEKRQAVKTGCSKAASDRWGKVKQKQQPDDAIASKTQCQPEPEPKVEKEETNVSSKKKRGTRLSEDWVLPREWGEWAVSQGWPEQVIRAEADKFRDYWISATGQKATKLDWLATWRNWMRNCSQPKVINGSGPARGEERMRRIITAAAQGSTKKEFG